VLRPQIDQAMREAKPDFDRAMADLRAHREEMKEMRPQIEQAMREAKPEIERAMAEAHDALEKAHVDERVRRHIEEAMQHIEMHMEPHHEMHRGERDHAMHDMDDQNSGDSQDEDHP
jgi:phage-related tail protein